jgi:hypothetical protein
MNKIISIRLLWVETHLMLGVSFIHALKCVAISPDLKIGEIKNPGKQNRALAQLNFGDQLYDHLTI